MLFRSTAEDFTLLDASQKDNNNSDQSKGQLWISDVIVGNFDGNNQGRQQFLAVVGVGNKETNRYWYDISWIRHNGYDFKKGREGVINLGTSYLHNTDDKPKASPYVNICAPDVNNDGVLFKYIGSDITYAQPVVQTILQSAPYFEDIAETYDDYLNNGNTGIGSSSTIGGGAGAYVSAGVGGYASLEISIGAAGDFEQSLVAKAGYSFSGSHEVITSIEYNQFPGED